MNILSYFTQQNSASIPPSISLCTFAKKRLSDVKETIPYHLSLLAPQDELIFVDYNDPERSGQWVKSLGDPRVKIIQVPEVSWWHMNHARNVAIKNASHAIVFVLDIDIFVTKEVLEECRTLQRSSYAVFPREQPTEIYGSCCFFKKDFVAINGYDETYVLWGQDDQLFYTHLENNGCKRKNFIGGFSFTENKHSRVLETKDLAKDWEINKELTKLLLRRNGRRANISRNWGLGGIELK